MKYFIVGPLTQVSNWLMNPSNTQSLYLNPEKLLQALIKEKEVPIFRSFSEAVKYDKTISGSKKNGTNFFGDAKGSIYACPIFQFAVIEELNMRHDTNGLCYIETEQVKKFIYFIYIFRCLNPKNLLAEEHAPGVEYFNVLFHGERFAQFYVFPEKSLKYQEIFLKEWQPAACRRVVAKIDEKLAEEKKNDTTCASLLFRAPKFDFLRCESDGAKIPEEKNPVQSATLKMLSVYLTLSSPKYKKNAENLRRKIEGENMLPLEIYYMLRDEFDKLSFSEKNNDYYGLLFAGLYYIKANSNQLAPNKILSQRP